MDKGNKAETPQELGVEIQQEVARGSYSNLAIITHSRNEFILDFATILPGLQKAVVGNRIVMNPENALRVLKALQDNIAKYEAQFGSIQLDRHPGKTFPIGGLGGNGSIS